MRRASMLAACLLVVWSVSGCKGKKAPDPTPKEPPKEVVKAPPADGLPVLKCGKDWPSTKSKDGKVTGCVVLEKTKIGDVTCKKMGRVELYRNGKLKSCTVKKAVVRNGIPCREGSHTAFFKSGKLKECYVKDPHKIDNVTCKGSIDLRKSGKLRRCNVGADSEVFGVHVPAESWVTLHANGKVRRLELGPAKKTMKVKKLTCEDEVWFYESGTVKSCKLAKKAKVKGKKLPKGTKVCFDEAGKYKDC